MMPTKEVLERGSLVTTFALNIREVRCAYLARVSRFNPLAAELVAKHFRMFLRGEAEDVVSHVIPPKVVTARAERKASAEVVNHIVSRARAGISRKCDLIWPARIDSTFV